VLQALNVETPSPGNSVANSPILPLGIGRRSFSNHRRSHTEHRNAYPTYVSIDIVYCILY